MLQQKEKKYFGENVRYFYLLVGLVGLAICEELRPNELKQGPNTSVTHTPTIRFTHCDTLQQKKTTRNGFIVLI